MFLLIYNLKLYSAQLLFDNVSVSHEWSEKWKSDLLWSSFHENHTSSCLWKWSISDYSVQHVWADLLSFCVLCWFDYFFSFCDENWDHSLKCVCLINLEFSEDDELISCQSCDCNFLMIKSKCLLCWILSFFIKK